VSDVSCMVCGSMLGWKYVAAEEATQRYKVGKYILETNRIVGEVAWDGEVDEEIEEWTQEEDGGDGGIFEFEEEVGVEDDAAARRPGGVGKDGSGSTAQAPSTNFSPSSPETQPVARHRSTSIRWVDSARPMAAQSHSTQRLDDAGDDEEPSNDEDSYSDSSDPDDNAIEDDDDEELMFDSQDEDECADLFAGVWSPALARQRRSSRRSSKGGVRR
jgi:hypothetical protein